MKPILSIFYVEGREMYINTQVVKTEKMVMNLLSNSKTKCGHPSRQEVCFSIQSGYPLTTTVKRGTKSTDIPGYRIYKDNEVVETQTSLEFSWTLKLRSNHLTVSFKTFKVFTCLETGALNFSFRRNAFPLAPFRNTEPHNLWCLPHCRHCPLPSVLVWPYRGQTYS